MSSGQIAKRAINAHFALFVVDGGDESLVGVEDFLEDVYNTRDELSVDVVSVDLCVISLCIN